MLELQNKIETLRKWHTLGIIQVTRLYEEQFRLMLISMENEVNKNFILSDVSGQLPLSEKKCGKCEMLGDAAPCDECYRKSNNFR